MATLRRIWIWPGKISALVLTFALPFTLSAEDTSPSIVPAHAADSGVKVFEQGRFRPLFEPLRTEVAALSPDGKHIAYSVRERETVSVVVVETDHPGEIKTRVQVINDDGATPVLSDTQREKTPARINWLRWVSPTRIVVETNRIFAFSLGMGTNTTWQNVRGAVIGFDADGRNARQLAGPAEVSEHVVVIKDPISGKNPFSIARDGDPKFTSRVWTPDSPVSDASVVTSSTPDAPLPALVPDLTRLDESRLVPRNLRIFDLDPARPDAVTVIATGAPRDAGIRESTFYSLNALSGKLLTLTDDFIPTTIDFRRDRQGRVRLTLPNSNLASFPFRYAYLGASGKSRSRPLDDAAGFPGFSVSPDNYFGEHAIPVGFDEDPNILYYATNIGRDTYGFYSLDLTTRKHGRLTLENPAFDLIAPPDGAFPDESALVFDRYQHRLVGIRYDNALRTTAWLAPAWHDLQTGLEKIMPGRSVTITDWDREERHFIVTTCGPTDAGAFFLYEPAANKLIEFARRAPDIEAARVHRTLPFSTAAADGTHISGLVTVPQKPRIKPFPMVVLCADLPWQRIRSDFQPEIEALADMGFAVVQFNGRGAWGFGLKQRQSLTAGCDLVQIEDIVSTVTNLGKMFNVNLRRVALVGRGHGGFIALRTLQTHPDKFRCAVAIDAPVDLATWVGAQKWSQDNVRGLLTRNSLGGSERLHATPLVGHPNAVKNPVLMFNYPGAEGSARQPSYLEAKRFANRAGTFVQFVDLSSDYMAALPAARAAVFDQIEEFLNTNVYDFNVKLRDLKTVK